MMTLTKVPLLAALVALAACGDSGPDNLCTIPFVCNSEGGTDARFGDSGIDAPADCDLTKDPKDSPACVDSAVGIFVDATKSDTNDGSKANPVATIGQGLSLARQKGLPRVYVCEGAYVEDVLLNSATSVYGGWKCGTWSYSGTKSIVGKTSLAFRVDAIKAPTVLADLSIQSANASNPDESSIAALVSGSTDVTFLRMALIAGNGKDGADAAQKTPSAKAMDGVSSTGSNGGGTCTNACSDGNAMGGKGGDVGSANATDGQPSYGGSYPNNGGHGMDSMGCLSGGGGGAGVSPPTAGMDQPGAATNGTLASVWVPSAGTAGKSGARGQGGGGGGARAGGGGGGGCGGCGGTGGDSGGGGGASIGVVSIASTVKLRVSSITTVVAGRGGQGAKGQLGQSPGAGGNGFTASPSGCAGGDGAQGSSGGSGGGGAGGLSVGVFYKGTAVDVDNTTQAATTVGTKGAKGLGGTPGSNDGIDGVAQSTLECKAPLCN